MTTKSIFKLKKFDSNILVAIAWKLKDVSNDCQDGACFITFRWDSFADNTTHMLRSNNR